jgi:uncharacterized protein (TIGR03790 family)
MTAELWAGGSGLNVVVVVNQNSTNSVELGNYYCEQRQVPPQNLLRTTNWTGGNVEWTTNDFATVILNPLLSMLAARQLTNQIEYVVLSLDFPYRVADSSGVNSTTAALFYGFKPDLPASPMYSPASCNLPPGSSNSYAGSEGIFRATPPSSGSSSFLVSMITSSNLTEAKLVIDHAVAGDSTFPTQTVFLGKSSDVYRNIRYTLFDNTVFNTRLRGNFSTQRTNVYSPGDLESYIAGYQNGVQLFGLGTTTFAPGAMADNLTSYGGSIFEDTQQTPMLVFLTAGAIGTYGTVVEPCAYLQKFPSPQNYFYQSRGFSLAECYYQSVTNPYQGLLVGEPLAAPFAQPAAGTWNTLPANALLSGTTNLSLQFTASDARHPVQQVDLFLDGSWLQTVTNIPPSINNVLYVTLNGFPTNYTVPGGATIKSVASNLTARLNQTTYTNSTKVMAFAHGDRIELQSLDRTKSGAQVSLSVSNSIGSGTALTTGIAASRTNFLDTVAFGIRGFDIKGAPVNGNYLQLVVTKTNGVQVSLGVTNNSGMTLTQMAQALLDLINATPTLQGADGLTGEDLFTDSIGPVPPPEVEFNLRARSLGWDAAQIQADLNGTVTLTLTPSGNVKLDENLPDLQPRNHIYITAGLANLPITFAFNSAAQADGYHELTAVAYEGSHVRTQKRVAQTVRIQNTSLSATFTTLFGDTNTALEATLQFSVVASTNTIAKIELISTGGSLGSVSGQSNALFSVPGAALGVGLHPFYALVTPVSGKQYRTETKWIRLVGPEPAFRVTITAPPPRLAWPATAGRHYDILSATSVTNSFQLQDSLTPSNSTAQWTDINPALAQRFYRVRAHF